MTTPTLRPLPLNTVMPVSGVSFRQEAVRQVVEQDEVRIAHDMHHPHDPAACVIRTRSGEMLGYVPAALAARLSAGQPGGLWRARVLEVLRNETWGLRIQLGPLLGTLPATPAGHDEPGLRHQSDGVVESRDGAVVVADDPSEAEEAPAAVRTARAKSGRELGTLVSQDGATVVVRSSAGALTTYPASLVRLSS